MIRLVRLLLLGFALGAAVAFAVSLLRGQRLARVTGYEAPVASRGPEAVPAVPEAIDDRAAVV